MKQFWLCIIVVVIVWGSVADVLVAVPIEHDEMFFPLSDTDYCTCWRCSSNVIWTGEPDLQMHGLVHTVNYLLNVRDIRDDAVTRITTFLATVANMEDFVEEDRQPIFTQLIDKLLPFCEVKLRVFSNNLDAQRKPWMCPKCRMEVIQDICNTIAFHNISFYRNLNESAIECIFMWNQLATVYHRRRSISQNHVVEQSTKCLPHREILYAICVVV